MFVALTGIAIGIIGGLTAGTFLFAAGKAQPLDFLDESADYNDDIPDPTDAHLPRSTIAAFLYLTPPWTKWPDFQRLTWFNRVVNSLWPAYNKGVCKLVREQAEVAIKDAISKIPMLDAVEIEEMDLGSTPAHLGGIKIYDLKAQEEVMFEIPISWGSSARARVSATIKLGPYHLYLPIEVSNILLKGFARITLKPLVETIPCLGAVEVTLLEVPYANMSLRIANTVDLMALPFLASSMILPSILQTAISIASQQMLVYPMSMTFDIMENRGLPPPPQGLLVVRIMRATNLKNVDLIGKSDPYCLVGVRDGREKRTRTIDDDLNPVWNEEFSLVVDDPAGQTLTVRVIDDDLTKEETLGVIDLPLNQLAALQTPRQRHQLQCDLQPDMSKHHKKKAAQNLAKNQDDMSKKEKKQATARLDRGTLYMETAYYPFAPDQEATTSTAGAAPVEKNAHSRAPAARQQHIDDNLQGVLTVTVNKCNNLLVEGDDHPDPFVELMLYDPDSKEPEVQTTEVIWNEENPKWGAKFDFVNVTATSKMTINVWDKVGAFEGLKHLKLPKVGKQTHRKMIGNLRLDIADVVRNKRMKDSWALQDTKQGEISLTLEWTTISFENDADASLAKQSYVSASDDTDEKKK